MLREIKVLTDYPNENIVALREHFRENEKLYLIFDYIDRNLLEELQSFASDKRKPNSSCRSKVIKSGAPSSNKKSEQPKSENAPDNEGGGLPPARIKLIVYQILKATAFLHTSKILHRDIKPENLLLSKNGVIKLCDFGFARGIKEDKRF
jgi:cyclin-dependent kinase-like